MKKLLIIQIIIIYFGVYSPAFAYIYNCPATLPDYYHTGDQEIWPEVVEFDPGIIGTFHLTGAQYNYITGEGSCSYHCDGCDSQGFCACKRPASIIIKGTIVEPIANDSTKWKPSSNGSMATCFGVCPWKMKGSAKLD